MLKKLMKYELKSTGRFFLPAYVALAVVAVINRLFIEFNDNYYNSYYYTSSSAVDISQGTVIFLYVVLILITCVLTFAIMVQRFNKNLLSDEGYLMFTLPVKTNELLFSKVFTSMIWSFTTAIVTVLSFMILFADKWFFSNFYTVIQELFIHLQRYGLGAHFTAWVIEFIIIAFLGSASAVLMSYAAIAIGHLSKKYRTFTAVVAYIGLLVVNQFFYSVVNTVLFQSDWFYFWWIDLETTTQTHCVFIIGICVSLVLAVGYYLIVNHVLTNNLNLE